MPTLLLLDGHSLAYRAYYALREVDMSTTTGQPTNAVFGFTSMLINLLRDEQPTHLAVAFDVSRKTFRTEEYPEYKANRSSTPEEFKGQVELIGEVLSALRIPAISLDGFEADDVIATLTGQARAAGMDVRICTGDRDSLQLVDEHTTVLYPKRGVSDLTRFTPEQVQEKYGLTPKQYPDFAALRGDPSDNLPGVPGVGEKTATKWIVQYGSLAELLANADQIKGKVGDSLREHADSVLRNRKLTELVRDVDVKVSLEDLRRNEPDREQVNDLFNQLQFTVLRERLSGVLGADPLPEAPGFELTVDTPEAGELGQWLDAYARTGERVGLAFSGNWGRGTGTLTSVALAVGAASGGAAPAQAPTAGTRAIVVDPSRLIAADEQALAQWLADGQVPKAVHDLKGPLLALAHLPALAPALAGARASTDSAGAGLSGELSSAVLLSTGWQLAGVSSDTQLAAYLLRPDQRGFELADLAYRYLQRELRTNDTEPAQLSLLGEQTDSGQENVAERALNAAVTGQLAAVFDTELESIDQLGLLQQMELPLSYVLTEMELVGIAADTEALQALRDELAGRVQQVAQEAFTLVGRDFNLSSPKQLQEILFDQFSLPKTRKIKSGYSTDADSLAELSAKADPESDGGRFLEALLAHREVARLKTVVDGLWPLIDDTGRIHTTFNQTAAATGRLSSTDPNLQNIPVRTPEGRRIRDTFVVGEGFETLMTADYSQIEMRIMAHLSRDAGLIEAFSTGEDLHTFVASRAFDLPPEQISAELRRRVKAMSYGLAYGLSVFGLSRQLRITPFEAQAQMDAYFTRFGAVRDYLHSVVEQARQTGFTETIMGRRRYLINLNSENRNLREMAERAALNAPIQGSAADIIKVAMLGVHRALREARLRSRMLLQVHDELVLEIAPGEREPVEALVREQMGDAYQLDVPLEVSVGFGRTWQEAAH